jgi:hypothetical protein
MEIESAIYQVGEHCSTIANTVNVPFVTSNIHNEQHGHIVTPSKYINYDNLLPRKEPQIDDTKYDEENRDRSMNVILPPTSFENSTNYDDMRTANIIDTLKILDEFLSLSSTRQVFDKILAPIKVTSKSRQNQQKRMKKCVNQHEYQPAILNNIDASKSIRFIQAGRYEIFVQARDKETHVFDWLCDQVLQSVVKLSYKTLIEMKHAILQYAIKQAQQDDRISACVGNKSKITYDNFSLIVSYDPVEAQPKHIDLLYPNFQYPL